MHPTRHKTLLFSKLFHRENNTPIARKLLFYILLISTGLTLIITSTQLYLDYKDESKKIDQRMLQMENIYRDSLANAMWFLQVEQINSILIGILKFEDVHFAKIHIEGEKNYSLGIQRPGAVKQHDADITINMNNKEVYTGNLSIHSNMDGVVQRLTQKFYLILISQSIKTFIVSIFVLMFFSYLVTRHLRVIAAHAKNMDIEKNIKHLCLDRKNIHSHPDELDYIVGAINQMTTNLQASLFEREKTEKDLSFSAARFDRWKESNFIGILQSNKKGDIIEANDTLLKMLGYTRTELNNGSLDWMNLTPPEFSHLDTRAIKEAADLGYWTPFEKEYFHKDGHRVPILLGGSIFDADPGEYIAFIVNLTDHKKQEEKIYYQAHYDMLTKLPNRFLSLDRLSQLVIKSQRNSAQFAVLFLDLDDFKKINDTLGHDLGDTLLIKAADRLNSTIREGDTVGRLGGDEFIVLLDNLSDQSDVFPIAEKLLSSFRNPFTVDGRTLHLTISLGIASYPKDGTDTSKLLRNADLAMYHAKDIGRNTYSHYTDDMNEKVLRRMQLEEQLHGALERNEFTLVYQTKTHLATNTIMGAEVLLRWHSTVLGDICPTEFIPIAEHTGEIVPIGKYVLQQALKMVKQWHKDISTEFSIAVNLSPRQFRDPDLVSFIEQNMKQLNLAGEYIELEITEGVLMEGQGFIDEAIEKLKALNIHLAMDDFGTGYSSLNYLRRYPFSVLKIDQSFISDMTVNTMDHKLISAAIAMAHSLDMKVVAEGVKTNQQFDDLKKMGCDYGQGYLFGKPVSLEQLLKSEKLNNSSLIK